ncbi:hypothetical protein SDC9_138278 [bioreactor metagenome]|uniref:Uncharacterized protein n=1 Tax=bioreactor metagenome TaxID=1076179 RepID=A0A645DRR4_9ZZZZ
MTVDHRADALMPADKPFTLQLGEAVPQLRAADVQPLGEHPFRRKLAGVAIGALLHLPQQSCPNRLQLHLLVHAIAPPCHTYWYYYFVLPIKITC